MKWLPLLLGVSLASNATLLGVVALRSSLVPPRLRAVFTFGAASHDHTPAAATPVAGTPRKLWSLLTADSPSALLARLRAAGFPPNVLRDVIREEINARYNPRLQALTEPDPTVPFWKTPPGGLGLNGARLEEYSRLQRERAKLLREMFAGLPPETDENFILQRRQFGSLSRPKIERVQQIEDDYADMTTSARAVPNGILLREDREKLALLAREKHADLAAVLSPAELADYEFRNSPLTKILSQQLGDFRASEAEFRAISGVQQQINDQFPLVPGQPYDLSQRRATQDALSEQLKTTLGEARYADYLRETSTEFQQLKRQAQRDNVPADTAVQAFDLRNNVSKDSLRIADDASLTVEQKRTALRTLAETTRNQLLAMLGPNAGPAFVTTVNNQWLNAVEHGAAVTFTATPSRTFSDHNMLVSLGSGPSFRHLPFVSSSGSKTAPR